MFKSMNRGATPALLDLNDLALVEDAGETVALPGHR
jgi:hypothetical protein